MSGQESTSSVWVTDITNECPQVLVNIQPILLYAFQRSESEVKMGVAVIAIYLDRSMEMLAQFDLDEIKNNRLSCLKQISFSYCADIFGFTPEGFQQLLLSHANLA